MRPATTGTQMLTRAARLAALAALASLCACGPRSGLSHKQEAWDAHSDPGILGLTPLSYDDLVQPSALKGQVPTKPWADSYWPYYKKDMAWRYTSGKDFDSVDKQIKDAKANPSDPSLSPAEKYDLVFGGGDFPLTKNSWAVYSADKAEYGSDTDKWSWMGICDGWSPASLAVPAPEKAVVVNSSHGNVLFFAGDLRGLASKSYDLNVTRDGMRMLGSRCDTPSGLVPRDALGRPYDGRDTTTGQTFAIVRDESLTLGALEVVDSPAQPTPYWLVAKKTIDVLEGKMDLYVYDKIEDVTADVQAKTVGVHSRTPNPMHAELFKACRDVNPASMHLALAELLSDAAPSRASFVVNISRYEQIWNQPVWGFTSEIGAPTPVAEEPLAWRVFRDPDAAYVAPVETWLVYIGEAGPSASYPSDAGQSIDFAAVRAGSQTYNILDMKYTLEFDADGQLIGGEWDEQPNVDIPVTKFLWRTYGPLTDQEADGQTSPLKAEVVNQLVACSQGSPDSHVTINIGDDTQHLDAVKCQVSQ